MNQPYLSDKDYAIQQVLKTAYFKKINYEPHPKQKLYHESRARFRFANCGRRFGKAEYIENLIPMTDGSFRKMKDVVVGDSVFGADGLPTKVVAVTEIMYDKPCAKVHFSDNNSIIVAKDHLWEVVDKNARKGMYGTSATDKRRNTNSKVLTTEEMQKKQWYGARQESNYAVKLAEPVVYETNQILFVEPYTLGLWLGDGNSQGTSITTNDAEILEHFKNQFGSYKESSKQTYYIHGLRENLAQEFKFEYTNAIHTTKKTVKYVPEKYLTASVEDRLALLQGLMDTDGTISNNGHCTFDNTNKNIADAVYNLVVSLGMKATRYERIPTCMYKEERVFGALCHRVQFYPRLPVFRLSRKLNKIKPDGYSPMQEYRFIKYIQDVPSVPVKCIQVANTDGLYLTSENFITTHNSKMVASDLQPKLLLPNKRYWIVGPTYDLAEKEFRVIWQDMIVGLQLGKDPSVGKAYNKKQGNMFIQFKNHNTILEVRSADHPENLVGDALDGVIMSEAAKHKKETWEQYIRPALSDNNGWADFATTPEGYNWLYEEWQHGKDDAFKGVYESWKFPSWDNIVKFPDGIDSSEIQLLKKTMAGDAFEQEIGAEFGSFTGKIYPEWDVNTNVQSVSFNPALPNYIAFDFGYNNPLAAIEFQVTPDDKIIIWREHYLSFTRLEEHIRMLKDREQPDGYHINMTFGDAADPEAVDYINQHFAPCLALPESKVNWRAGIDLVRSFLTDREVGEDDYGGPLYAPALLVDPSCINTIKEFNNYKSPGSVKGKNVQEIGLKQDDHALDAIRYALVHIYQLGATSGLADVMDLGAVKRLPVVPLGGPNNPHQDTQRLPGVTSTPEVFSSDPGYFTQSLQF